MTELPKDPWDLRKVLREIKDNPADYHETDVEIDRTRKSLVFTVILGPGGPLNGRPRRDQP